MPSARPWATTPKGADAGKALAAFSRGALLGARGNSGVILSQMLGAIAHRIADQQPGDRNATVMAEALQQATDASYAAVGEPVEGTILTVARAASDAAMAHAADPASRARDVLTLAAKAAREALARTPEQLKALRDAGVVDAGGRGLSVILDAAETVLTGRRPPRVQTRIGQHQIPGAGPGGRPHGGRTRLRGDVPPRRRRRADPGAPADPRARSVTRSWSSAARGCSTSTSTSTTWAPPSRRASARAGRTASGSPTSPSRSTTARQKATDRRGRRIVAVAAGPGLAALFAEAGAFVVEGGPGRRPSTGQVLEAITDCGAAEVVVLPNDADSVRVAEIAARTAESDEGMKVSVIPTNAQVQGLAAIAVHEPGRTFEHDVLEMTATARHARHGAVTIAARQAITMAGPCEPGDVLGVIAGDFAVIGDDLETVATDVLERLLAGGGELVTIVGGAEDSDGLAARCAAVVEERHPHVDVVVYDGGQERYPLLMSVE